MRRIKFDTIHRALTGPDNTWLGRQNAGLKTGGGWLAKSPSRESVSLFLTPPGYVPSKERRGLSLWGHWAQQNAEWCWP